jgi:MFS family permease
MSESSPLLLNGPPSDHELWKPGKNFRWIRLATTFNVFLMGFDGTIAASTYAVIGSEFQSMNQVSWISASYLITSTAFQPLYGYRF